MLLLLNASLQALTHLFPFHFQRWRKQPFPSWRTQWNRSRSERRNCSDLDLHSAPPWYRVWMHNIEHWCNHSEAGSPFSWGSGFDRALSLHSRCCVQARWNDDYDCKKAAGFLITPISTMGRKSWGEAHVSTARLYGLGSACTPSPQHTNISLELLLTRSANFSFLPCCICCRQGACNSSSLEPKKVPALNATGQTARQRVC